MRSARAEAAAEEEEAEAAAATEAAATEAGAGVDRQGGQEARLFPPGLTVTEDSLLRSPEIEGQLKILRHKRRTLLALLRKAADTKPRLLLLDDAEGLQSRHTQQQEQQQQQQQQQPERQQQHLNPGDGGDIERAVLTKANHDRSMLAKVGHVNAGTRAELVEAGQDTRREIRVAGAPRIRASANEPRRNFSGTKTFRKESQQGSGNGIGLQPEAVPESSLRKSPSRSNHKSSKHRRKHHHQKHHHKRRGGRSTPSKVGRLEDSLTPQAGSTGSNEQL